MSEVKVDKGEQTEERIDQVFSAGYRVQQLIDAAQRSRREGTAIKVVPMPAGAELRA
jgi:hypothetical protein